MVARDADTEPPMTDTADPTAKDPADRPGYYHPAQIVAHWTIVMLLVFQFATGGGMEKAFNLSDAGVEPLRLAGAAWVHGLLGTSILLVMIWRLLIRVTHPVPPPPDTLPKPVAILSRAVHYAFYVFLIAMPLAGLVAVFTGNDFFAAAHGLASKVLLGLVALHVAGGLYHAFKRDGVVKRILRQDPAGQYDARTDRPAA